MLTACFVCRERACANAHRRPATTTDMDSPQANNAASADVLLLRDCASIADLFQVVLCVTAVLVFAFGFDAFQKLLIIVLRPIFGETEKQRKIRETKTEMEAIQREMSTISQINDFAKYFKRERMVNKLKDEIAALEKTYSTDSLKQTLITMTVARVLVLVVGLTCMWSSADLKAFRFYSADTCWPFCFVMDMPRGASRLMGWSTYGENEYYMSMFVFLNFCLATSRRLPELKKITWTTEVTAIKSKSD